MNNKKKIFILVLLFPVVWTIMLTAVGYVYSKNVHTFYGLGTVKIKNDGTWPVIIKAPHTDQYGEIVSYQPAWRYLRFNGSKLRETAGGRISPKDFGYDDLRKLIENYNHGKRADEKLLKVGFEHAKKWLYINVFIKLI